MRIWIVRPVEGEDGNQVVKEASEQRERDSDAGRIQNLVEIAEGVSDIIFE